MSHAKFSPRGNGVKGFLNYGFTAKRHQMLILKEHTNNRKGTRLKSSNCFLFRHVCTSYSGYSLSLNVLALGKLNKTLLSILTVQQNKPENLFTSIPVGQSSPSPHVKDRHQYSEQI